MKFRNLLLVGTILLSGGVALAASAPDTLLVTGPNNQQVSADVILVTPSAGAQQTQTTLAAYLGASLQATIAIDAAGFPGAMRIPLTAGLVATGIPMTASASSSNFGVSMTAGTSLALTTNAANSSTVTNTVLWEVVLPPTYVAGSNITLKVNGNYNLGSGTVGTHTLAMSAYLSAADGTQGSTLIATAAQSVPATAGDMTFVITGTTLTAGARLVLKGVMVIQDTGGSAITGQINSVRLSS